MRTCTGCKKSCYNTCARGAHGWCADCRNVTGDSTCNDCRAKESAARSARIAARQQSKAASVAASQAYTPYVPPIPQPIPASHIQAQIPKLQPGPRKALYLMSEAELEEWTQGVGVSLVILRNRETLAGNIVLSIGCDFKSDADLLLAGEITPADKERVDDLHLRKIDLADEVLILNVGGYIGESTKRELAYAKSLGKVIRWLEEPGDEG